MDFLSDAQKMNYVLALINNGFSNKVLISHDIFTKHRMVSTNCMFY